ncbi:MAG: hypothetical protein HYY17_09345, partial [Planctomycetes bacterium]|nr:hypothetical protein [Planctomycetota bacterium]
TGAMTVTGTGTLSLTDTATLKLGASISVGTAATSGGLLTVSASSGTPTITRIVAGTFAFTVRNGGRVAINGLNLSYTNGDGLHLMSDAAAACDVDNCAFSVIASSAVSYSYKAFLIVRLTGGYQFSECSFTAVNPLNSEYNVSAPDVGSTIEMLSAAGAGSGASYENDPQSRITWPVFKTWTGTTSTNWDTATNWSPNGIPTSTDNVRIPDVTNDPIVNADEVTPSCKSLLITTGTLTINAVNTLNVYGDLTIEAGGTLTMTAGTLALRGGDSQSIDPGGDTVLNLTVNKTGGTATLATNTNVSTALTLTAGTLDVASATLTVGGATTGTGTLKIGGGTFDANGSIDLTGGTLTCTGSATIRAASTVTSLGTFTALTSAFVYDGATQTVLTAGAAYYDLTIAQTGGTTAAVSSAAALSVSNDLTLSTGSLNGNAVTASIGRDLVFAAGAGTYTTGAASVSVGRNFTASAGTLSAAGSTFTFNGTTQAVDGTLARTFDAVTINGTSNTTIASGLTIATGALTNNGTITFAATSTTLLDANGAYSGSGAVVFASGGELRLGGSVTSFANLTAGSGKVTFDSGGAQSVAAGVGFTNLTVNKAAGSLTISPAGSVTVGGALAVDNGSFDIAGSTVTVTGATTISATGSIAISTGVLDLNGSSTIASGGTIVFSGAGRVDFGGAAAFPAAVWLTPSTGTVRYDRTDANFTVSRNGATGYNHLTILCGSVVASADAAGTTTVAGNLTVSTGTFAADAMTINVAGNATNAGTLRISTGLVDLASGTFDGTGGTISFTGAGLLELGGPVTDLGTLNATTGTVRYNSAGAQSVDNVMQYYNLDVPKTAGTATAGGTLTIAGALSVSGGGTLDLAAYGATVTGGVTVSGASTAQIGGGTLDCGGTYDATGGSTTFAGAGTLVLRGTVTSLGTFTSFSGCTVSYRASGGGQTVANVGYYHLDVNAGSAADTTAGGALAVAGNLTITAGRLSLGANNLTVTGSASVANGHRLAASTATIEVTGAINANSTGEIQFSGAGALKLRGTVTSLGAFTAGSSTVEYLGTADQTMAPVTYANVTITDSAGMKVVLSGTSVASGTLTLTGGAARTLELASGSDLRVDGTMTCGASTTLKMTGTAVLRLGTSVSAGGTFDASGTSPNLPTVTWNGSTRFAFTLSGTVTVNGLNVSYPDSNGMWLDPAATLTANTLTNVRFSNAASPGVWLNFRISAAGTYTVQDCDFPAGLGGGQFNIRTPPGYANTVNVQNYTGGSGGESKEDDRESGTVSPGSIVWFVVRTWTGATDTSWTLAANWTPSDNYPQSTEDAIVPNVSVKPTLSAAASCRGLTVQTSSQVNLGTGGALTLNGNLTNSGTFTFAAGTSITFDGTAAQTFTPGSTSYLNIVVNKTAGTVTLAGNLTVSNNLTITVGTLDANSRTVTVSGTLSFGGSGTRALNVSTGTVTVSGTFNGTGGTTTFTGAGTLAFSGTVSALGTYAPGASGICSYRSTSVDQTVLAATYNRLQVDTVSKTATLGGSVTANGLVEVLSGTLDLGTNALQANQGVTVSSGATLKLAGTGGAYPQLTLADAKTLSIQGTLRTTTVNSANRPVITRASVGARYDFTVSSTGELDVKGLKVSYAGYAGAGSGLDVADGATWTAFESVELTNAKSGGRHLTVARNAALDMGCPGCFFDGSYTVGSGRNVKVTDGNGGSDVVFSFDYQYTTKEEQATLSTTAASAVVTDAGATFVTKGVAAGDHFLILGGSDAGQYVVSSVDSETQITLAQALTATASNVSYRAVAPTTGAGSGNGNPAQRRDDDGDANCDNLPDSGGAVVQWVTKGGNKVSGSVQLDPTSGAIAVTVEVAFDAGGAFLSAYMVSRNADGANNDRVWVLDATGAFKNYSYDVPESNGDIVGSPFWTYMDINGTPATLENVILFGTTSGYLYFLEDTGAALNPVGGWPFQPPVAGDPDGGPYLGEVTSPMNTDGAAVFFGGKDTSGTAKLFSYSLTTRYRVFATGTTTPVRTRLTIDGAPVRVFAGTDASGGVARAWSIRASDGVVYEQNSDSKAYHLRGAANVDAFFSGDLFIADYGGRVHRIDAYDGGFAANVWSFYDAIHNPLTEDPPGVTNAAIYTMVYVDQGNNLFFGDRDGHVYNLKVSDGTKDAAWTVNPRQPDGANAIMCTPLVTAGSVWIGNNNGKLFRISRANGTVQSQWYFGSGVTVSDVTSDNTNGVIMVVTSTGKIYYVPQ